MLAKISGPTFGKMWRDVRCQSLAPSARARSTYVLVFSESTWARITRAVLGQEVIPITKITVHSEGVRIAASTIARGRNGSTRNQSVNRIRVVSRQPP